MNKKELISALENLPDNTPIWLGVDSGEGWLQPNSDEIFLCNAIDCPLDGDHISDHECEYVPVDNIPKEKSGDEFIKRDLGDGEIAIGGPIIVIGTRKSKELVESYKFQRENKEKIERENLLSKQSMLKEELEKVQKELSKLENDR